MDDFLLNLIGWFS